MAYPSPWSPSGASPRSPTVKSPSTPGSRRVRFDDDQSNPSIRFIPPTPLSPGNLDTPVEDYSNEPGLFDTPTTTMNPSMRPAWSARRPSMPTPPAFEEADVYYTPTDGPESEYNSRPLVIPPPPYDHVWRDILTANEAAFRLRDALSTTSTEDVRTLTKSYPPAVAARLNLHEHQQNMGGGSGGGGGGVGVWPLPSAPGTTVSMAASTVPTTPALTAATMSTPGSVFTSLPAFTGGSDPDFPHSALSLAHANLRDAFLLFSEQFPTRAEHFGLRGRELTYTTSENPRRYDSRERGLGTPSGYPGTPGAYSGPGTPGGHHTPGTPGGYGYEDARGAGGGYGYGYAKPGDFTRPGMRHQDSNMSSALLFFNF
ncbi:hypothetical protein BDV93DRAFT_238879 [Ceratobasidium sp. AG-I]|nr:hypothetical protein BDV93DRAFT_238879 [Ceratobasidium sp. AG-I]